MWGWVLLFYYFIWTVAVGIIVNYHYHRVVVRSRSPGPPFSVPAVQVSHPWSLTALYTLVAQCQVGSCVPFPVPFKCLVVFFPQLGLFYGCYLYAYIVGDFVS